jgi:hypothetical protein
MILLRKTRDLVRRRECLQVETMNMAVMRKEEVLLLMLILSA